MQAEVERQPRPAIRVGTIVARNYLPYARVLAESLAAHHPGARLTCLVIDDRERRLGSPAGGAIPGVDILHVADLVREPGELERMAMCYDVMELATAVKPWLLEHLLAQGTGAAVYLDPDVQCFASLDEPARLARRHGIVLTPHTTEPIPRDGRKPSEADLMETGTYNLGFVAVSDAAGPFLAWWQVRLRRDAIVDPGAMLFTDQRWVDLVPGYFPVHILRDPGYNVAYWNLGTRVVEPSGDGYTVNNHPLRFLHFSGYDPDRPHLLSRHQGDRPRVLLSERPVLRRLCDRYRDRLLLAGWGDPDLPAYGYGRVPGGPPIDRLMRRCYRQALLASEADGRPEPPNPFRPGEAPAFVRWLMEPVGGPGSRLTRYLDHLYHDRVDLQVTFKDVPGPGTEGFLGWARDHGVGEEGLPTELVPDPLDPDRRDPDADPRRLRPAPPRSSAATAGVTAADALWRDFAPASAPPAGRRPRRRPPTDVGGGATGPDDSGTSAAAPPPTAAPPDPLLRPQGVNVAGYLEAELGLGTAARGVLQAIERSGSPVSTVVYRDTQSRQSKPFAPLVEGEAPYDCNLVCINGDLIGNFVRDAGTAFFEGRYTIAQWHWETDTFPDSMRSGLDLVDEVWVASRYERQAIQRETDKPVLVFPMPVVHDDAVPPLTLPREALGLPQGFCFLFCFDYLSVMERKNPVGLVEAFGRAFPAGSGVHLVVKSINGDRRPNERERLRLAAAAHPDVLLLEAYLTGAEVQALTAGCDAYVSLHRAEGFGLTLADAMAVGRPVIATRYSGNLEFMSDETGYLVDCALVPVGDAGAPYPPTHRWADPDLDHAAALMRQVVADPDAARARGARGQARMRERFTTAACAAFVRERLAVIRAERAAAAPAPRPSWLAPDGAEAAGAAGRDGAESAPAPDRGVVAEPAAQAAQADPVLPEAGPSGADEEAALSDWTVDLAPDELAPVEPALAEPAPVEAEPVRPAPADDGAPVAGVPVAVVPTPIPPLPVTDEAERLIATRGGAVRQHRGVRGWAAAAVSRGMDRLLVGQEHRQRAIAQALVAAIREVAGTVPAAADLVHGRVDGAEARRAALADRVEGLTGHVDRLTRHVHDLGRHVNGLDGHVRGLDGHVRGLDGHVRSLDGRLGTATAELATLTDHLDRVTRHLQGLTELVDRLNGRTDSASARQERILLRHDRLASRVDRMEDLVTHLERVERELVRARRASDRLVAAAAEPSGGPPADRPAPPARRRPRRGTGGG